VEVEPLLAEIPEVPSSKQEAHRLLAMGSSQNTYFAISLIHNS
jgi:hypothetical protein